MIWETEKKVRLTVKGEDLNIVFRIPNAMEVEDVLEMARSKDKYTDPNVFKMFVTHVDGFDNAEQFVKTPGTSKIIKLISEKILESSSVDVTLKNESGSSTV